MNTITLVGRLARDPEPRRLDTGSTYTKFVIADNRPNSKGEEVTDYFSVIAWGKKGEFVYKFFKKGKPIAITGRLQTNSYEKDGVKQWYTEIIASDVSFVPSDNTQKTERQGEQQSLPFPKDEIEF